MPTRLRPTASIAADAILVGDPGRSLLLAQELLETPRMSNHARGLWGYSGRTPGGTELTIQATGMGGPSAAIVLADLATLGVRRAIRVGTCTALGGAARLGDLLLPGAALAVGGSATPFGVPAGGSAVPDPDLLSGLRGELGDRARSDNIASLDTLPAEAAELPAEAVAADLQTAALLARGALLEIPVAAVLAVNEIDGGERLEEEALAQLAKRAGRAASAVLST